uniref:Uncharacterized protein n=1 Tax=Mycena chlorophos TaxID=658473 RepID=A0ABQ0KTY0_MYCCL|nr:predicted protein [Mycena chlorophos]
MAAFAVPRFTESIQQLVEDELTQHSPPFTKFYTGILWPTAGDAVFVPVPVRLGLDTASSPYDLDPLWWLGLGGGPEASSFDLETTALTVTHWPFDDPTPLKRSYTVFVTHQGIDDAVSAYHAQPPNALINSMAHVHGRSWRGNILVTRSALHSGTKGKYECGVTDMSERDMYVARGILKSLIEEELLGRHPAPFFSV